MSSKATHPIAAAGVMLPHVMQGYLILHVVCRFDTGTLRSFQEYKVQQAAKKAAQARSAPTLLSAFVLLILLPSHILLLLAIVPPMQWCSS